MYNIAVFCGVIAQLGERLHGMQEVTGSIPVSSLAPPLQFFLNLRCSFIRYSAIVLLFPAFRYGGGKDS